MSPLWKGRRFPASHCISGWAMHHRETVAIRDIRRDPRIPPGRLPAHLRAQRGRRPGPPPGSIGAIGAYWATLHLATAEEISALEHLAARGIGHQIPRLVPKAHKAPSARATTN